MDATPRDDTPVQDNPQPVSDARVAANRRNAQRSTGPRSAAGKARTRLNAITNGGRCETVVLEVDQAAFEQRILEWSVDLQPRTGPEHYLLQRNVLASIQLERLARAKAQAVNDRQLDALDAFEAGQEHQTADALERLQREPGPDSLKAVTVNSDGCMLMADHWFRLAGQVRRGAIGPDWIPQFLQMVGRSPDEQGEAVAHLQHWLATQPEEAIRYCSERGQERMLHATKLIEGDERIERTKRLDQAALAETPEDQRWQRYEVTAERTFFQCYNELKKAKKERDRRPDEATPTMADIAETYDRVLANAKARAGAPNEPKPEPASPLLAPNEPKPEADTTVSISITATPPRPPRPLTGLAPV